MDIALWHGELRGLGDLYIMQLFGSKATSYLAWSLCAVSVHQWQQQRQQQQQHQQQQHQHQHQHRNRSHWRTGWLARCWATGRRLKWLSLHQDCGVIGALVTGQQMAQSCKYPIMPTMRGTSTSGCHVEENPTSPSSIASCGKTCMAGKQAEMRWCTIWITAKVTTGLTTYKSCPRLSTTDIMQECWEDQQPLMLEEGSPGKTRGGGWSEGDAWCTTSFLFAFLPCRPCHSWFWGLRVRERGLLCFLPRRKRQAGTAQGPASPENGCPAAERGLPCGVSSREKGGEEEPEAGGQGQESGWEEALSPGRRPARPWPKSGATRRSRRGVPPSPIRSVPVLPGHQEVTGSSFVAVVVLKHKSSGKAALCVARQVIIHMFVDICRLTWLVLNEIQQLSHVRLSSSQNSQPPFPFPLLFPFPLSPFPFLFPLSLCSFPFLFPSTLSPFVFPFTLSSLLFPFTLFTYDHCECHKWSYHHVHSFLWTVWWKYQ